MQDLIQETFHTHSACPLGWALHSTCTSARTIPKSNKSGESLNLHHHHVAPTLDRYADFRPDLILYLRVEGIMTISFRWPETWVKRVTSSIPPTTNTKWRASLLFTWDGDIQSFFYRRFPENLFISCLAETGHQEALTACNIYDGLHNKMKRKLIKIIF